MPDRAVSDLVPPDLVPPDLVPPDLVWAVLAAGDRFGDAPALTGPPPRQGAYRGTSTALLAGLDAFRGTQTTPLARLDAFRGTRTTPLAPRAAVRGTLTHAELAARIRAVAHRLRSAGFAPGERLLFSVRPSPEAVVLALGTVAAGGTVVFVDPGVGPSLFAARTELAAPGWAAAESLLYAVGRGPARALARRRGVLLPDYAGVALRHIRVGRWLPGVPRNALEFRSLVRPVAAQTVEPAPDQDAVVVFTAGTTDAPKAVVHTRGSLGAALDVLSTRCALGPGTRVHTDQFLLGLPALVGGGHWSMPPYGFAPGARPAELARGLAGATHTFLIPADLAAVLDAVVAGEVALPSSLRQVVLGSAPVLPPLLRRAQAALPDVEFLAVYGMTEILPVAIATADEKLAHTGGGDLLGAPLPGVRARVTAAGELVVAGANLARGYLGEEPMREHPTGDLARIDDGRIVLVGRAKDMIIRGSVNIYPGLHEPLIAGLPGVAAALLIGVPDAIGDERVVLVLVPSPREPSPCEPSPRESVRNGGRVATDRRGQTGGAALVERVRAALPGLIDAGALPDEIVVLDAVPVAGRTRKPDRAALRAHLTMRHDHPGGGDGPAMKTAGR